MSHGFKGAPSSPAQTPRVSRIRLHAARSTLPTTLRRALAGDNLDGRSWPILPPRPTNQFRHSVASWALSPKVEREPVPPAQVGGGNRAALETPAQRSRGTTGMEEKCKGRFKAAGFPIFRSNASRPLELLRSAVVVPRLLRVFLSQCFPIRLRLSLALHRSAAARAAASKNNWMRRNQDHETGGNRVQRGEVGISPP